MRDLVVEKASPLAFLIIVMWYVDTPRNLVRGILYETCINISTSFALIGDFIR